MPKESEIIKTITINDSLYPQSLKKIPNPPEILYYKGDLQLNNKPVLAVVGTRRCSDYGKEATAEIVGPLARAGFIIVSGLAKGIDALAHINTLENKGRTIAVLGTGIDKKSIFPQENIGLAERIIKEGGAVISEFPPLTPGHKSNFPQRNRIIAGLSLGVVVIEAKQKSGALITAHWAFKQGKKVFALPGSIYSPNSQGCHYLIKKGAVLIEKAEDIIRGLQLSFKIKQAKIQAESPEEELILGVLQNKGLHIDQIIEKTKLTPAQASSALVGLEMKDKIKNLGGNIFIIKK